MTNWLGVFDTTPTQLCFKGKANSIHINMVGLATKIDLLLFTAQLKRSSIFAVGINRYCTQTKIDIRFSHWVYNLIETNVCLTLVETTQDTSDTGSGNVSHPPMSSSDQMVLQVILKIYHILSFNV